jgi:hypothetical protein
MLDNLSITFVSPTFSFQPPEGLYPAFSGAFYLFDCMNYCLRHLSKENIFVFLDPDCLVMDDLESLRRCARQWPLIGYDLELEKEEEVNGCSRSDLLAFLCLMESNDVREPPTYFGGEFLIVNGQELGNICEVIDQIWKLNLANFLTRRITLKTEEHVLSVALARLADRVGRSSRVVKRMWTRPSFRNVSLEDERVSIWHLPAEKRHGFQRLFVICKEDANHLANLGDEEFRNLVADIVRLKLSVIERLVYFFYPILKRSAKRLVRFARK